jgi:hypothetical protein
VGALTVLVEDPADIPAPFSRNAIAVAAAVIVSVAVVSVAVVSVVVVVGVVVGFRT